MKKIKQIINFFNRKGFVIDLFWYNYVNKIVE